MGRPTGFLEIKRQDRQYKPVAERVLHYDEFIIPLSQDQVSEQGARCMDCGIPFCHQGCPINNVIPDWNDLVSKNHWQQALAVLHSTNNFPEFTGRICPAPCEAACTLNFTADAPVTIRTIECAIVDKGWEQGWIKPQVPAHRTGKSVAIVGSGPAGLACAQQLVRAGHKVTVYEKNNRLGGLLRYGIPDFKFNKNHIDRRIAQMQAEGVTFHPNTTVGEKLPASQLLTEFNAVVLAGGSEQARCLPASVKGHDAQGVHRAMDFLSQQNKKVSGDGLGRIQPIDAKGKQVVVIGGGDTGSDCVGTSIRQGAARVTQLEIMPQPPQKEAKPVVWPNWPNKMRTSSSQEEGCQRDWSVSTKEIITDEQGKVSALKVVRVDWSAGYPQEIAGSEFTLKADLVLLAMGFVHPVHEGLLVQTAVDLDERGNVQANDCDYSTSIDKVFVAGDMRRGQSLVVWAIREGRQAARAVDAYLMGFSDLPR
jgi:glutamate synthase (NADPH/NADH) small chain